MSIRPRPVEQAASFLQSSQATTKEKLVIGGKLLQAALVLSEDWTPDLLEQAKAARKFLFQDGSTEKTLGEMDEKAARRYLRQFTEDVTKLAADVQQARSQRPPPHKP